MTHLGCVKSPGGIGRARCPEKTKRSASTEGIDRNQSNR